MPTPKINTFWEKTRAGLDDVDMNTSVEEVEDADVFTMEGRPKTRHPRPLAALGVTYYGDF